MKGEKMPASQSDTVTAFRTKSIAKGYRWIVPLLINLKHVIERVNGSVHFIVRQLF